MNFKYNYCNFYIYFHKEYFWAPAPIPSKYLFDFAIRQILQNLGKSQKTTKKGVSSVILPHEDRILRQQCCPSRFGKWRDCLLFSLLPVCRCVARQPLMIVFDVFFRNFLLFCVFFLLWKISCFSAKYGKLFVERPDRLPSACACWN